MQEQDQYLAEDADYPRATAQADTSGDLRIPVHTEELVVEKEPVAGGSVHLHKGVETVEQTVEVPVVYEEAVVEHLSPDQYRAGATEDPDTLVIPIYEEQIVVEKRTVLKEYVRVRKERHEAQQTVTDTVRREYVEVRDQQGGR